MSEILAEATFPSVIHNNEVCEEIVKWGNKNGFPLQKAKLYNKMDGLIAPTPDFYSIRRQYRHAACADDRSRGRTAHKVRRQALPSVQRVRSGRAKGRRDIRRVLAAVRVGRLVRGDIDGIVRGRPSKQPRVRRIEAILQRRRRYGKKCQHTADGGK